MTILELFRNTNKYNLVVDFEKLFPYEEYDWLKSRNIPNIHQQNEYLLKVIDDIVNGNKYSDLPQEEIDKFPIVYVVELDNIHIDSKDTNFEVFTLKTTNFETLEEYYVARNSIEFIQKREKNNQILNYTVCQKSIDTYGIDICATTILHNLIIMGYGEQYIERKIDIIVKQLKKSEKDIKEGRYYTADEVFAKLYDNFEEHKKTLDKYELARVNAYEAEKKVYEPIEKEYRDLTTKTNLQRIKDFIS